MTTPTHATPAQDYIVGGVRLPRPFRIRRLGHFGVNVHDPELSKAFYCKLLGLRISDEIDFSGRMPDDKMAELGPRVGYFTRHGTDHHSFVIFPRRVMNALAGVPLTSDVTTNQITWQAGSLR